jgi:hypothetical protein
MTEREARDECARLSAEHPDRETHRWVPTQRDGEWVVAKIGLPPPSKDTQPEIRADKQPAIHDDVRSESPLASPPTIWFHS